MKRASAAAMAAAGASAIFTMYRRSLGASRRGRSAEKPSRLVAPTDSEVLQGRADTRDPVAVSAVPPDDEFWAPEFGETEPAAGEVARPEAALDEGHDPPDPIPEMSDRTLKPLTDPPPVSDDQDLGLAEALVGLPPEALGLPQSPPDPVGPVLDLTLPESEAVPPDPELDLSWSWDREDQQQ